MGWWFGRMMTFEVIADDNTPSIGSILTDASGQAIVSGDDDQVIGFAAYGRSIKSAVEPLVDCFDVELFDDGTNLITAHASTPVRLSAEELGNSTDGKQVTRLEREQVPARDLPNQLRLTYYEASRDYQTGEARATVAERVGADAQWDLPAVLEAGHAKAIAHTMIARAWSDRDRLTLRLPPSGLALQPGNRLELELSPALWRIEKTTIDGFVVICELRPSYGRNSAIASDSGRIVTNADVLAEPLSLSLIDVPSSFGLAANDPIVLLAATTAGGWQRQPVEMSFAGRTVTVDPARSKSIVGYSEDVLGPGSAELLDERNSVTISLVDDQQWLTSCTDDALAAGENMAVVGNELVQFGNALSLGGARFRLSRLLRGRGGSEWAMGGHSPEELFCLLRPGTVQPVALPNWSIGAMLSASTQGGLATSILFVGENAHPLSPVNLVADVQESGDVALSWTRRSRQGFAWVDGIDAPIGEAGEQYRVNLTGLSGSLERVATQPWVTIAGADMATLGAGSVSVEVRQIGDLAASRPAQLSLTLS